jgi:hypothetical protein
MEERMKTIEQKNNGYGKFARTSSMLHTGRIE